MTPNVTELCLLTDYDYNKIQKYLKRETEKLFLEVKAAGRLWTQWRIGSDRDRVLFEEQDAAKECTVGKETGTGGRKVTITVT